MSNSGSEGENVWDNEEERARRNEEERKRREEERRRQWQEDLQVIGAYLKEIRMDRDWRLAQRQERYNDNYYEYVVDHLRYILEDQYKDISENNKYENFNRLVECLKLQERDNFEFPKSIVSRVADEIRNGKPYYINYGFHEEEALGGDEEEGRWGMTRKRRRRGMTMTRKRRRRRMTRKRRRRRRRRRMMMMIRIERGSPRA